MRRPSISARHRSSSSSAIGRIPLPDAPPPPPPASPPLRFPMNSPPRHEPNVKPAHVDEEEVALALAIALSEKELRHQAGKATQEEEDIAKAIEESLKHAPPPGTPTSSPNAGPLTFPKTTSSPSFPSSPPVSEQPVLPETSLPPSHTPRLPASLPVRKVLPPLILPEKPHVDDDEALAQQLAEEEEMIAAAGPSNPSPASPPLLSPKPETVTPPAPAPSAASQKRREAQGHRFHVTNADSDPLPPPYHHVHSASTPVPAKTFPTLPAYNLSLGRRTSASAVLSSSSRHSGEFERPHASRFQSLDGAPPTPSSTGPSPPVQNNQSPLPTLEVSCDAWPVQSPSSLSSAGPITPNSFIDQQLLNGVCKPF